MANLPIALYPGMKIGQISFFEMTTAAEHPYGSAEKGSKYQGQRGPDPEPLLPELPRREVRRRSETSSGRDDPPVAPAASWAGDDPLMREYHDVEWGVPQHDRIRLFEKLCLEGAQAGLSWRTILNKREGYRACFAGFEPAKVARFTDARVEKLMLDARIVRNRAKITSVVDNAKALLRLERELAKPTTATSPTTSGPSSTARRS